MAKEYDIAKASGACTACHQPLEPGRPFTAVLIDKGDSFQREDYCLACGQQAGGRQGPEVLGVWQARMPTPQQPARPVISNAVLVQFFDRLADSDPAAEGKLAFRFVLGLMLMRKKLLVYDKTQRDEDGRETWTMHYKSDERAVELLRPDMDEDRIAEVTGQLREIFEVPA